MSQEKKLLEGGISSGMIIWPLVVSVIFIGFINLLIPNSEKIGLFLIILGAIIGIAYFLVLIATGQAFSTREPGLREDI